MKLQDLQKPEGTYVAVLPTTATLDKLQEWAKRNDVILNNDLHVTILYSRVTVNTKQPAPEIHVARGMGFDNFDGYLVLRLIAPTIELRHNYYRDYGGTHDHPEFNPHMTLFKMEKEIDFNSLEPIDFDLILFSEYITPLD